MIDGYKRKPTKFEWCGATVWLFKLTKADREAAMAGEDKAFLLDIVMHSLAHESGELQYKDRAEAEQFFSTEVAEDDFVALGKLVMNHSDWNMNAVDVQKKS